MAYTICHSEGSASLSTGDGACRERSERSGIAEALVTAQIPAQRAFHAWQLSRPKLVEIRDAGRALGYVLLVSFDYEYRLIVDTILLANLLQILIRVLSVFKQGIADLLR